MLVPHPGDENLLLLIGGVVNDGGAERTSSDVFLFDLSTNTWQQLPPLRDLPPLAFAGTAFTPGAVMLVGGATTDAAGVLQSRRDILELRIGREGLIVSPVTSDSGAVLPRMASPAVGAFDGTVFVFGGDSLDTEAICTAPTRT